MKGKKTLILSFFYYLFLENYVQLISYFKFPGECCKLQGSAQCKRLHTSGDSCWEKLTEDNSYWKSMLPLLSFKRLQSHLSSSLSWYFLFIGQIWSNIKGCLDKPTNLFRQLLVLCAGREGFESACNSCSSWHRRFLAEESLSWGSHFYHFFFSSAAYTSYTIVYFDTIWVKLTSFILK